MRFSVIIPLYNKAPYVAKAIQSVLAQSFTDYELVIVDDGSHDRSGEIAERLLEGHDNCRLFRQENMGVSVARNNGVAASSGDYLCFLDADDWWEPTFLEEMSQLIEEFPEAGIYGTSYVIVNETKHKTRVSPIGVETGFEKGYINYCQVYAKTLAMPLTSISVAIPRAVFDEMRGFPKGIKLGEDFMLWIRIALKYKVAFLNKPLAYYNQDVDVNHRVTNHLTPPKHNYLWQTDVFCDAERTNADYKLLIDRLRAYDLQPYYLSYSYHLATAREIEKIDNRNFTTTLRRFYSQPLVLARIVTLLRKTASNVIVRLRSRLEELGAREWAVGIVEGGTDNVKEGCLQVKWLKHNYKDRWFADPFILSVDDDRVVLLVEEYLYKVKKGRISKLVVNRDDLRVVENKVLLETPTHLSFPAILRHEGKVYVYPESSATGRLCLYEYDGQSLSLVSTLCKEPLTDAIITSRFGGCLLYSTKMPDPNGNTLCVYRSDSLFGPYSPCERIVFFANDARMAGDFFDCDGVVFKPSQDCDGGYGKAIRLYETRDGKTFKLHSILTSPHPRLREGMHTVNSLHGIVVVDVVGYKHQIVGKAIQRLVSIKKRFIR